MVKFIRWQEVKHMPRRARPAKVRQKLKKGISLPSLLRSVSGYVDVKNARYVKPFRVQKLRDAEGKIVFRAYTHTNDPRYPPERDHMPSIRPKDPRYKGPITKCPEVLTDCTCARNVFKWEYANALRGNGLIWRGNGEPPLITNPNEHPGLCKHQIALAKWLMQRKV